MLWCALWYNKLNANAPKAKMNANNVTKCKVIILTLNDNSNNYYFYS
jgi:hypothetical protein